MVDETADLLYLFVRCRYSASCSIEIILRFHCFANAKQSSRRAIEPVGSSGLSSSQMTPTDGPSTPARRTRSIPIEEATPSAIGKSNLS